MKFILPQNADPRFSHLANVAAESGFAVSKYCTPLPQEPCIFVFPFNLKEDELLPVLDPVPGGSFVFVGKSTEKIKKAALQKKLHLTPLLENQRYVLKNAEHTAEGTLAEILTRTDEKLSDLCVLIYGYGNCGRAIARLLWLCGCEVWVWSRQRGQALATKDGFNLYPAPEKGLGMFDAVINTVPDPVFSTDFLSTMRRDAFFFQVASGLSGIDPNTAKHLGIRFVPIHGLPGKYCPVSESYAIWEEITCAISAQRSTL